MIYINLMTLQLRRVLYSRKWYSNPANKTKHQSWAKQWNKNNIERKKDIARGYTKTGKSKINQINGRYGEGAWEHFNKQLNKQKGLCAICLKPAKHRDHHHASMRMRGWLCAPCNFMLGYLKEDVDSFQRAITYLQEWSR